jgi:hypothetical protein
MLRRRMRASGGTSGERGTSTLFEYWSQVARTEVDIRFGYEILAATPEKASPLGGRRLFASPRSANQVGWNLPAFHLIVAVAASHSKIDRMSVWVEMVSFRAVIRITAELSHCPEVRIAKMPANAFRHARQQAVDASW